MNPEPTSTGGWLASLRRLRESWSALLCSRFELFTVELQEEKLRLLNLLVWLGIAVAVGTAGVLLAITALALWLWATLGYAGLVGLAAIDFAVAFGIVRMIYARMRRDSTPFAQTMAAFLEDGKCLRNNS